ncbi:dolichol phosphate-mannose biosynthesis regulatory [Sporodiniella umbellata]|nr:dolichol phosphate-mannose biosynthesis regulatory [Sporodiniella umbellata]
MAKDKTVGTFLFFSVAVVFVYYTIWVLVMPFVDKEHSLQYYFPHWRYAIQIPILTMIIGLTVILTFLALVMIKTNR